MFMIKYSHVTYSALFSCLECIGLASCRKKTRLDTSFKRPKDLVQNAAEIVNLRAIIGIFFLVSVLLKIITPLVHMCLCKTGTSVDVVLMRF